MISPTKILLIQLSLALVLNLVNCEENGNMFNLILHSKDRGARCLDGSPAGMYIHEGTGANKNKYIIYFRGGGFCEGLTLSDTI